MATTARDVLMVFRAQNYLSGAIRRVGKDVGSLSRTAQLSQQRVMLQSRAAQLRYSRSIAAADAQSIASGSRGLALQQAKAKLTASEYNNVTKTRLVEEQRLANASNILKSQTKIEQLTKAQASGRPVGRGLNRMSPEQVTRALQAEQIANDRLLNQRVTLNRQAAAAKTALSGQSVTAQQLAAREIELVQREAQLRQAVLDRTRAIEQNTLAQARNDFESTKIAPIESWAARAGAIEHAGRALQMFGLIATAAFGIAANSAAKFSSQFTLAATQARAPGQGADATARIATQIRTQVMSLMQQFPAKASEMSDAFYQIFSGTNIQSVKVASQWVKTFNQAAVAGGASLGEMVQAGISIHNIFPGEFKTMTQGMNVFAAAVRYGRMSYSQFADVLGYIAPIAKDVHLSFKNVAEDMAFFTRQTGGKMTRQDAQGLARLIQLFAREDVTRGLASKGIPVWDKLTGRMRPVVEIIKQIHDQLKLTPQETINFFKTISAAGSGKQGTQGTIQAIRIFSQGINNGKAYLDVTKHVRSDSDEMIKAFEAMSKTPGVRWQVFINQLRVLVYEIGTKAIPAFITMGKPLVWLADHFNRLSDGVKNAIAVIGTFAAGGALVGGTFIAMTAGLARLVFQLKLLSRVNTLSKMVEEAASLDTKAQKIAQTGVINPRTGAVFSQIGKDAPEAAGLLSRFKGEGGAVSQTIAMRAPLVALIPLMIMFHKQTGEAVNALGGLGQVIRLTSIAMAGFTLVRAISGISNLISEAVTAGVMVSRLRLALLGISGLTAVATIIVLEKHKVSVSNPLGIPKDLRDKVDSKLNAARNFVTKYSGAHAVGNLIGNPFGFGKYDETRTPKQLQAIQAAQALANANANDPRLTHVIRANQGKVDAIAGMVARKNLIKTLNTSAGITAKPGRDVAQWIALVEKANAKRLANPNSIKDAKAYEVVLNNLNKRFKQQPALLSAINDVLANYNTGLKDATNNAKTLGVTTQDVLSSMQSMYNNFKSQEQSIMGTLFQGPLVNSPAMQDRLQWGGKLTGKDLLKDLRSQIRQFTTFHGQINRLSRKGAPNALVDELMQQGTAALPQIKALNQLTPKELHGYFNAYNQSQKMIQQQSMRDLNRQLKIYRQHGRNIALAIIAGLRDENVNLTKSLTKMIHSMFPGLPTGATGAGGKPTHHKKPDPAIHVSVHPVINTGSDSKPVISKKAAAAHAALRSKNKFATPVGGPR